MQNMNFRPYPVEMITEIFLKVVSVHDELVDPTPEETRSHVSEEGAIAHGHEGLGAFVRQGTQAGPIARREDHRAPHPAIVPYPLDEGQGGENSPWPQGTC